MKYRGPLTFLLLLFCGVASAATGTDQDFMRSTGKIYVVAAVCLVILLSLFAYIIRLDRKITQLEKRQKHE